jgi:phage repressor protein C with HTH and peptisase S24 domain
MLDMNPETLGGYERGDSVPDLDFLLMYKQRFSVNLDWLISGEGEPFTVSPQAPPTPVTVEPDLAKQLIAAIEKITRTAAALPEPTAHPVEEVVQKEPPSEADEWKPAPETGKVIPFLRPERPEPATIKYFNVPASAGGGRASPYEPPGEDLDIGEMAANLLGLDIEDVFLSPLYGDSMLPTLAHGDIAVVNRRDVDMETGRIYLVSFDGQLYVKRAQWDEDGDFLWLMSDNDQTRFPPMKIAGEEFQQLRPLGRVVWVWRPV